jgi:predicted RNA-binding Zn ribbon-like protein
MLVRISRPDEISKQAFAAEGRLTGKQRAFEWIAGHVALDFTNTVTWRRHGLDRERLQSYSDLVRWSSDAGILETATINALQKAARERPKKAATAYREAVQARAGLHVLFVALATGRRTPLEVVTSLNARTRRAMTHVALRSEEHRISVGWNATTDLDRPLWPLLKATVDLLTSADLSRLRLCANPECGWVFLDRSRKRNRRWCSMRECGSKAKARAYYQRQKEQNGRS